LSFLKKGNYQAVGWFDGWLVGWKPTIKLTNQQTFPESLSRYEKSLFKRRERGVFLWKFLLSAPSAVNFSVVSILAVAQDRENSFTNEKCHFLEKLSVAHYMSDKKGCKVGELSEYCYSSPHDTSNYHCTVNRRLGYGSREIARRNGRCRPIAHW
jgi:hypothetical protein